MSNTKLTKQAKAVAKQASSSMIAAGARFFSFPEYLATVLIVPDPDYVGNEHPKMVCLSISVCSDDEQKFRRWTGIDNVIDKFDQGEFVKVVNPGPGAHLDMAVDFAYLACAERYR